MLFNQTHNEHIERDRQEFADDRSKTSLEQTTAFVQLRRRRGHVVATRLLYADQCRRVRSGDQAIVVTEIVSIYNLCEKRMPVLTAARTVSDHVRVDIRWCRLTARK
jgi:hypothetical protein